MIKSSLDIIKETLRENKISSLILLLFISIAGLLEALGITLIIPVLVNFFGSSNDLSDTFLKPILIFFANLNVFQIIAIISSAFILKSLILQISVSIVSKKVADFSYKYRKDFMENFFNADLGFVESLPAGKILAHISNDTIAAAAAYLSIVRLLSGIIQITVYTIYIFYISWLASLSSILIGILLGFAIASVLTTTRKAGNKTIEEVHQLSQIGGESTQALKEIKSLNIKNYVLNKFNEKSLSLRSAHTINGRVGQSLKNVMDPLIIISGISMVFFFIEIISMTPGEAIVLLALIFRLLQSAQLSFSDYQKFLGQEKGLLSIKSIIQDLEDRREYIDQNKSGKKYPVINSISLKNIDIFYGDNRIIDNLSLEIDQNSLTVITGSSGSGKTTLMDVMLGLKKHQNGEIFFGDIKFNEVDPNFWSSNIGYMSQDSFLIEGTIEENIVMGRNKLSNFFELEELSRMVGLEDFISDKREKFNFMLSEGGKNLSGGQKQRLSLARAIYHKPSFLFLDEPTSALDYLTEKNLLTNLNKLKKEMTIICISHSLQFIKNSDKHIDLNNII